MPEAPMSPRQRLEAITAQSKQFAAGLDNEKYAEFRTLLSNLADACERLPPQMVTTSLMLLIGLHPPRA